MATVSRKYCKDTHNDDWTKHGLEMKFRSEILLEVSLAFFVALQGQLIKVQLCRAMIDVYRLVHIVHALTWCCVASGCLGFVAS